MACTQCHTSFQPATQWTQDPDNHILRLCLPGFQKDEFKVQVDNCGKLTIKGGRTLADGKYMRLDQVFDVPNDSQVDKIRGKFEDARLFLFMPRKVVAAAQRDVSCDRKKTVEPSGKVAEKKEECQTHKDEQKKTEEHIQKATPKGAEAPKWVEATQAPAPVHEAKPSTGEPPVQKERKAIPEQKPTSSLVSDEKFEEYKKKAMALKVRIEEEVEGWLDYGLMDGLLETISKNKKTIAIAAAAFSAGFYISRKLRSS